MSYVRFMNGTNPIWDFIAEMGGQEQGREREHSGHRHRGGPPGGPWAFQAGPHGPWDSDEGAAEHGPWTRGMPHRPRHGHGHGHGPPGRHGRGGRHHGPPPPPGPPGPPGPPPAPDSGDNPPPPPPEYSDARSTTVQAGEGPINLIDNDDEAPAPDPEISTPVDDGAYSSGEDQPHRGCRGRRNWHRDQDSHPFGRHHGRGGMRGPWGGPRGFWGPAGMPWGPPPRHHHPHPHRGHQRRGSGPPPPPPPGAGGPFAPFAQMFGLDAASFDPDRLREAIGEALQSAASSVHPHGNRERGDVTRANNETSDEDKTPARRDTADFRPAADIYDAADAYIVHFALPGAKKEDISLNWDAEKSELNVAGVITREGDEEVMKTLALDERDVGVFERRVKLGREGVEAEGISAKMENGLLVVRVPKKVAEDEWTEVMKVDIE